MSALIPPVVDPANPNSGTPSTSNTNPEFEIVKQQLAGLTQVVGQLANSFVNNQPVNRTPEPAPMTAEDMQNNPQMFLDRMNQMIDAKMAPIHAYGVTTQRQQAYVGIKNQVKLSNLTFAKFWNLIEPHLDATFASGQNEVNHQLVAYQAQAIFGGLVGQNPNLLLSGPPAPIAPSPMIQPSGAPVPNATPPVPLRELSEVEREVARRQGLSHEEYLKLQEGSAMIIHPKTSGAK